LHFYSVVADEQAIFLRRGLQLLWFHEAVVAEMIQDDLRSAVDDAVVPHPRDSLQIGREGHMLVPPASAGVNAAGAVERDEAAAPGPAQIVPVLLGEYARVMGVEWSVDKKWRYVPREGGIPL